MTERWAGPGNVSISIFPFNFQKTVFLLFVARSINYILVSQGTKLILLVSHTCSLETAPVILPTSSCMSQAYSTLS